MLELPQRDLGGQLPAWDDLVAQTAWARERGAAVHLDGARLWEASAGYGRPPAEVAALFDTAYVSFYKGLGALAGCCLAGPEDVVAEVREWRGRMGGTLFGLWPGAASALHCLRLRLPRMPAYLERARAVADAVRDLPGVTVVPDPPQTPMLHLLLRTSPEAFLRGARELAEQGLWTWPKAHDDRRPGGAGGRAAGRRRDARRSRSTRSATPWRCSAAAEPAGYPTPASAPGRRRRRSPSGRATTRRR